MSSLLYSVLDTPRYWHLLYKSQNKYFLCTVLCWVQKQAWVLQLYLKERLWHRWFPVNFAKFSIVPTDLFNSKRQYNKIKLLAYAKNIRELSWMSHRVIRFWFLFNFLFISAIFDILASLSIYRFFSSGFSGRRKSSWLDIPRTIIKCDDIN